MMRHMNKGTCSSAINFDVENDIITSCEFIGGCDGNTKGLSKLVVGRPVDEIINLLEAWTAADAVHPVLISSPKP